MNEPGRAGRGDKCGDRWETGLREPARARRAFGHGLETGEAESDEDGAVTKCRVCATGCDYVFGGATQGGRLFVLSCICT